MSAVQPLRSGFVIPQLAAVLGRDLDRPCLGADLSALRRCAIVAGLAPYCLATPVLAPDAPTVRALVEDLRDAIAEGWPLFEQLKARLKELRNHQPFLLLGMVFDSGIHAALTRAKNALWACCHATGQTWRPGVPDVDGAAVAACAEQVRHELSGQRWAEYWPGPASLLLNVIDRECDLLLAGAEDRARAVPAECIEPARTISRAGPRHSFDFCHVVWFGTDYIFTPTQSACVKVLWEAWEKDTPTLREQSVLEAADSDSDRLEDIFRERVNSKRRTHPAWGTMIVPGERKGTVRLAAPQRTTDPRENPSKTHCHTPR